MREELKQEINRTAARLVEHNLDMTWEGAINEAINIVAAAESRRLRMQQERENQ